MDIKAPFAQVPKKYHNKNTPVVEFDQKYTPYDHTTHEYTSLREESNNGPSTKHLGFSSSSTSHWTYWNIYTNGNILYVEVPTPVSGSGGRMSVSGEYTFKWKYFKN